MNKKTLLIFYALFALSGASGLMYESVWSDYLKLYLGHAAYAQVLVLCTFMGGLALGAFAINFWKPKRISILQSYIIVELLIGIAAIFFHQTYLKLDTITLNFILPQLNNPEIAKAIKWFLATLIILPQTILLGATFPLLATACIRLVPKTSGRIIATLYFTNSLGAAAGILVAGFSLRYHAGLPGVLIIAGCINILVAFVVWVMTKVSFVITAQQNQNTHSDINLNNLNTTASDATQPLADHSHLRLMLLCALFTGMASFLYEIGWIRMLTLVLGASTHAFELMLSAFILGLALGSFWIRKCIHLFTSPIKFLGYVQLCMGLAALFSLWLYQGLFVSMEQLVVALSATDTAYMIFSLSSHIMAFTLMLPVTFLAGTTLPLVTHVLMQNSGNTQRIGQVYACNTLGSILGVLIGYYFILPIFGLKQVMVLGAFIDITLGIVLLYTITQQIKNWSFACSCVFTGITATVLLHHAQFNPLHMASGVFRYGFLLSNHEVLFKKDGKTATVTVMKSPDNIMSITTNGKPDASISFGNTYSSDESTQTLLGLLPWSIQPNAKRVVVIGLGSGMTTHELLNIPSIESIDTIEIEPVMVTGAKLFGDRVKHVFEDPRSRIHYEDARTFFPMQQQEYDLIISEPSNPWVSGVASLYTTEFYQMISKKLTNKGLFVQWLHLYEMNPNLLASVILALAEHFQYYDLYLTDIGDVAIIANNFSNQLHPHQAPFELEATKTALEKIHVNSQADLQFRHLGSQKLLFPYFNSLQVPANSDFFPYLDLHAEEARFKRENFIYLNEVKMGVIPISSYLDRPTPSINLQQITDNAHLKLTNTPVVANSLYKMAITGKPESNMRYSNQHLLSEYRHANLLCDAQHADVWLLYLHKLMEITLPHLDQSQQQAFWQAIHQKQPCLTKMPAKHQAWWDTYRSIIFEQFPITITATEQLLNEHEPKQSAGYAVALGMNLLAHFKIGDYKKGYENWKNLQPTQAPLQVEMIAAHLYIPAIFGLGVKSN